MFPQLQTYTAGEYYYAEYSTFSLGSESLQYALHLGSYSGDAYDSISSNVPLAQWIHDGMMFSTQDVDNDRNSGQCAQDNNGAWWFNNCFYSCLACSYSSQSFSWWSFDAYEIEPSGLLRAARMMTRSV